MPISDGVVWLNESGSVTTSVRWLAGVSIFCNSGQGNSALQKKPARKVLSSPSFFISSVTIRGPFRASRLSINRSAGGFSDLRIISISKLDDCSDNASEPYLIKYETMMGIFTVLEAVKATSGLTEINW